MSRRRATHDVFHAIADPTRREILDLLSRGERTVNSLVAEFRISQPAVSQHLKVLRDVDLVGERRQGRQRIYRLRAGPLKQVADWVTLYRQFWTARLEALGDYLDGVDDDGD